MEQIMIIFGVIVWSVLGGILFNAIQKDIVVNNIHPFKMLCIIVISGPLIWFLTLITYLLHSEEQLKKKSEENKRKLSNNE